MRVEVRADGSIVIDGYVNAVERESRPVMTPKNIKVNEKVEQGVFQRAIDNAENIELRLDHKEDRVLGSTQAGNLQLFEDNIGLRAIATVNDEEVRTKAERGLLKGWSFGMYVNENGDVIEERANQLPLRTLKDISLFEVSLIDEKMNPIYAATSIEMRADEKIAELRATESHVVTEKMVETPKKKLVDYTQYENRIKALSQSKD